jgi:FkbM family methyltransferase
VFYDIGANAGFYAIIGARCVGEQGWVYAFEPTPELAERIRYNAEINNFDHVDVVTAAVCDEDGTISFGSEGFDVANSIRKVRERPCRQRDGGATIRC